MVASLDELPSSPCIAEQTDGNNSLPSDTDVLGDMAVPHECDDPTEAVTEVAMQMEITGATSGSRASDTCALVDSKTAVPHVPVTVLGRTASGTGCYVTNMRT